MALQVHYIFLVNMIEMLLVIEQDSELIKLYVSVDKFTTVQKSCWLLILQWIKFDFLFITKDHFGIVYMHKN